MEKLVFSMDLHGDLTNLELRTEKRVSPHNIRSSNFKLRIVEGSFAAIFGFDGSKKWMQRDGFTGISRTGSGAPSASGFRKSRGLRMIGV